jgi:hypothetical protein
VKLQLIRARVTIGTTPFIGASNAVCTCATREVILMYFTSERKIDAFNLRIKASHWLKLSEIRCARTTAGAVAVQGIKHGD